MLSNRRFLAAAMAVLGMALAGVGLLALSGGEAEASPAAQGQGESACIAVRDKFANPGVILLGETVDVTLTVTALCAGEQFPLHIVLVLDASGSMAGEPTREMKKAARELIKRLDIRNNPSTKVGVVSFNSTANVLCQLTDSTSRASSCVNRVGASGGTSISQGIIAGIKVFNQGRRDVPDPDSLREVMVVLSDGADNAGCGPVQRAAGQASGAGILVVTVCVGDGCDVQCMRSVASSPRYFFEARQASQLGAVFEQIRKQIQNVILKQMTVIDTLPDNMEYVEGSGQPEPNDFGTNNDQLTWRTSFVPKEGVTYTFKLRPREVGYHRTNNGAYGEFRDNKNRTGSFDFLDPYVLVLKPESLQTPTMPPTPTPTNTPTNTPTTGPTLTPTPTPTNTPTPKPGPIYLPITLRERCVKDERLIDVALVIDMSTSMDRNTSDGVQKKQAVIDAAKHFVSQLDFTPSTNGKDQYDQVAVVGFNDDAWIEHELSNDEAAINAAIESLPERQQQGTRLDKAFEMGMQALPDERRKVDNTPVIIMLTDGLPNRVPFPPGGRQEDTVIASAQKAKDAGMLVYTIGFGQPDAEDLIDRVNAELLSECATSPDYSFVDPSAEGLAGIYEDIADVFTCPDGRHDWGAPWPPERGRGG